MGELIILAVAGFVSVFLLGLCSQFVRDKHIALAFICSWLISAAQFAFTRIVANTDEPTAALIAAALGSSTGIACSIIFYSWLKPRITKGKQHDST